MSILRYADLIFLEMLIGVRCVYMFIRASVHVLFASCICNVYQKRYTAL